MKLQEFLESHDKTHEALQKITDIIIDGNDRLNSPLIDIEDITENIKIVELHLKKLENHYLSIKEYIHG